MARTIAEIYDALNQVKGNMPELGVYVNNDAQSIDTAKKLINDVRNASKVAVWRLWLWVVAVGSWVVENYMDVHEAKIRSLITSDKPHTLKWYANESKKFQYGHEIEWLTDHFGYATIDPDAQVVKYASAWESVDPPVVQLKVMKEGKVPLSGDELMALDNFWRKWKDAGIILQVNSSIIDTINFEMTIYRNRSIVNADNTLITDPTRNVVQDPANAYIESIEFDGLVYFMEIVEKIKTQPGIINAVITGAFSGGYIMPWVARPNSGFCYIDWAFCVITYEDTYV